jgi:lipopolysaccharide/colanic/teichoic acid biosynthesis glycosyltransferase
MKVAISERVCPPESIKTLLRGSISGIDAARTFNPDSDLEIRGRTRTAYNIPCDSLVLGFVGRIGCDKGIEELWEAWRCLRSEFPSLHLLVVGPFDERDPIRPELMKSFRDDPKVHLTGQVEETSPFYSAMDVFALPSHREGFGLAAIEASAMKLPVVASRIAGCVDATLDGVTGTLVQPRDASALSDAIRRYLLDSELRLQHGRAGRHRVLRDFRQDEIWQTLESEYRRLLRASRLEQPTTLETRAQAFSRRRAHQIALKRALDVAGATVGLVLVSPLLLGIALLIRLGLRQRVLFCQIRPGRRAKSFTLYKFRTMEDLYDQRGELVADELRLGTVGRILRTTSLDELPELFNVLKGDMSLVGPRPLLLEYLDRYTPEQARRHEVKPGITGWAQVNGRNKPSWQRKLALDVWYVDNWTLLLDLKILWLTVFKVLKREGINADGHTTMPRFLGTSND